MVIISILLGSLGASLGSYVPPTDFAKAVAGTLSYLSLNFYMWYAPHSMRTKLLQTEDSVSSVLADGEEGFHRLFGGISATKPQVTILVLIVAFFDVPSVLASGSALASRALAIVNNTVFNGIVGLAVSSVVWTYYSSLWGIHKMGKSSLRLRPYYKDRLLGLRPIGSLALTLVIAYFVIMALLLGLFFGSAPDFSGYGFISALTILGLLMFFVPLRRLHQVMLEQKKLERDGLEDRLPPIFDNPHQTISSSDDAQALILETLRVDMMKREISSIAVWPFDIQIVSRLVAVSLTVAGILVASIIRLLLRF